MWIWDSSTAEDDFECLAVSMDHTQDVKHVTFSPKEEVRIGIPPLFYCDMCGTLTLAARMPFRY